MNPVHLKMDNKTRLDSEQINNFLRDMSAKLKAFVFLRLPLSALQQLQIVLQWFSANFPQLLSIEHEEEKRQVERSGNYGTKRKKDPEIFLVILCGGY